MPAGFYVAGDHGVTQIDGTFFNFLMVSKGSATTAPYFDPYYGNSYYRAQIYIEGNYPLLFVGQSSAPVAVLERSNVGGVWTFTVCSGMYASATFTYYVFDVGSPALSSFGAQVFSEDGSLVFDALAKSLRVHSVIPAGTVTLQDEGKTYAVAMSHSRTIAFPAGQMHPVQQIESVMLSDHTCTVSFVTISERDGVYPSYPPLNPAAPTIMVADVTGY